MKAFKQIRENFAEWDDPVNKHKILKKLLTERPWVTVQKTPLTANEIKSLGNH